MNQLILNNNIQEFINKHLNSDIAKILFKGISFTDVSTQEVVEQIEAKKRCEKKLPTWFENENIYFPNKLNIEQTSSEKTALYKSNLVNGISLIDLTGGFGVDCFYFSKKINQVTHCEINEELSEIVSHNFNQLEISNIQTIASDGIEYFKKINQKYDWVYIDPSRRNDSKGKVFLLRDCLPNVPNNLELLFKHSDNILIKYSPILDITSAINELRLVKEIHVVAVNNEVKELLFILENNYLGKIQIKTTNILKKTNQNFDFIFQNNAIPNFGIPEKYLYEPNAAIMKSGGFNDISTQLKISKLHQHSHLYTSDELVDFPGRRFEIKHAIPFDKKLLKRLINNGKANITTRNFPQNVAYIRKKLGIKDGGNQYVFFTTDINDKHIVLICEKIRN
ncbi:THUMP-like domain-containing protein [Urechidicola croceus]|uniref:SAM-dependent methyltransferase n=1 Tax=Urechidicola croceus TaxID=1850246 RepID=A0A1D8P668_9FLAO|nr:SAM-dependent methyltransferase [Urechidicola croceus]AOW20068.1 SAM-dependent methyltransferase [Urechidicola croceus]